MTDGHVTILRLSLSASIACTIAGLIDHRTSFVCFGIFSGIFFLGYLASLFICPDKEIPRMHAQITAYDENFNVDFQKSEEINLALRKLAEGLLPRNLHETKIDVDNIKTAYGDFCAEEHHFQPIEELDGDPEKSKKKSKDLKEK